MNPTLLPILLIGGLVASALTGPRMIRLAAPALAPRPRLAIGLLSAGILIWLIAFAALGPLFAWMATGKYGSAAGFCRKCLESSNPWTKPVFDTGIPTTIILAGPALLITVALAILAVRVAAIQQEAARAAARLRRRARAESCRGRPVLVLDEDDAAAAFALPSRHGGVVLSTATLDVLEPEELDAVLAHERAHLVQRHHLIAAISRQLAQVFRPVPAIRAAAQAMPLYLEIAADNAARKEIGTRPLVSALLRLDSHRRTADIMPLVPTAALHATGPDRIQALVCAPMTTGGRTTVIATSLQHAGLVALSSAVALPWLVAMTSGCA